MDVVKIYNTTITCEGVSVVIVLSLSLRKKGSSVFGDRGQRRSPPVKYLYNVTKLRMCNTHHAVMNGLVLRRLFEGGHYNAQPWDCAAPIRGRLLNGVRRLFEEIRYIYPSREPT